ncbi:hypothetical protein OY671_011756, partial [Metschnikowia pulcherrima]
TAVRRPYTADRTMNTNAHADSLQAGRQAAPAPGTDVAWLPPTRPAFMLPARPQRQAEQ